MLKSTPESAYRAAKDAYHAALRVYGKSRTRANALRVGRTRESMRRMRARRHVYA